MFRKVVGLISFVLSLSLSSNVFAQQARVSYAKQLTFNGDNDVLAFKGTDRYYTNGLQLQFSYLRPARNPSVIKSITQWEGGQKMFTASKREVYSPAEIDRPIAGYLYAKYSVLHFKKNNQLLQWSASVGTIGKASLAATVQNGFHPLININSNWWGWIWDYQVKNEVGLDVDFTYAKSLINTPNPLFQITSVSNITLGTTFTNATQGLLFQFGKFNNMSDGSYWNARIKNTTSENDKRELFLFYKPEIMYQAYNATIQGGMFRKDKGPITGSINPFMLTNNVGLMTSGRRWTEGFQIAYQTKEAKRQINNHAYGRITFAYRFN